ncbi:MAG: hypothetical protein ACP5FZ_00150 [Fidelibacterota bacterium]
MVIAKYISVLLHPFICGILAFLLILSKSYVTFPQYLFITLIIILAIVVFPAFHVMSMKRKGQTISLDIPERQNRISSFIYSIVIYTVALILLWIVCAPRPVLVLMWVYAFNTVVATLITKYWKISIHGMALGGPIAALGQAVAPVYYWGIVLVIPITYSRVRLKAHTPAQVMTGFALGFILTIIHFKLLG